MLSANLPIVIQERDISILRSLFESRIMTAAHLSVLFFEGRAHAAKRRLYLLKEAGLIAERPRRVNEPAVLFITGKALKLLADAGVLADYPRRTFQALQKRAYVSDLTVRHELTVMDMKAAFFHALRATEKYVLQEFNTWPALLEFTVQLPFSSKETVVKPDGFVQIREKEGEDDFSVHSFFVEVDRSFIIQPKLVPRALGYIQFYKSGGFAARNGAKRDEFSSYPFRVLMVFKTSERRNNFAEQLLQLEPPILTQIYLSTLEEVKSDPLGTIWVRPFEYRAVTANTRFDPARKGKAAVYKRETQRDVFIEKAIRKFTLFDNN